MPIKLVWPRRHIPHVDVVMAKRGTYRIRLGSVSTDPDLKVRYGHPVYEATVASLMSAAPSRAVRHTGWRYMLLRKREFVSAAEVYLLPESRAMDVVVAGETLLDQMALRLAGEARCCLSGKGKGYEPRLLRIPELCLELIWLKPRGSIGLFTAMDARHVGLMPGHTFGLHALRQTLTGMRPQKAV